MFSTQAPSGAGCTTRLESGIKSINPQHFIYELLPRRTLWTDGKLAHNWVAKYADREPEKGGNLTATMLRYYKDLVSARTFAFDFTSLPFFGTLLLGTRFLARPGLIL